MMMLLPHYSYFILILCELSGINLNVPTFFARNKNLLQPPFWLSLTMHVQFAFTNLCILLCLNTTMWE